MPVFNDAVGSSDYIVSKARVIKDVEGGGLGLM
jgi:hypothetical protein